MSIFQGKCLFLTFIFLFSNLNLFYFIDELYDGGIEEKINRYMLSQISINKIKV